MAAIMLRIPPSQEAMASDMLRMPCALANASSGVPRTFVSACATAIAYAVETEQTHVRDHQVDLSIQERFQPGLDQGQVFRDG